MGKKIVAEIGKLQEMNSEDKELQRSHRNVETVGKKIAEMFLKTKIAEPKIEIIGVSLKQAQSQASGINKILKNSGSKISVKAFEAAGKIYIGVRAE